jgi:hypothetical protein
MVVSLQQRRDSAGYFWSHILYFSFMGNKARPSEGEFAVLKMHQIFNYDENVA